METNLFENHHFFNESTKPKTTFRPMRRKRQQLSDSLTKSILERNTAGTLALSGDHGYPYAVPISYVYDEAGYCIYFHSARAGHKLDAICQDPKASFCVIDQDEIIPEAYTTYFRSVIVFGRMEILEDEAEKRKAMEMLGRKYAPQNTETALNHEIESQWKALMVLKLSIDHLSGKEAVELISKHQ